MANRNDEIRQANRKALPKFVLIVVLSCLIGGVCGFCAAFFGLDATAGTLRAAGEAFCLLAPWLLTACAVLQPVICLPMYFTSKREASGWNGEDETVSSRIDRRLSIVMWINGIAVILSFFLLAAAYTCGPAGSVPLMALGVAGFAAVMVETIILQQKLVDLCKRLNPEKQGSVYDMKFQKTWLDSCDEAEKVLIGQCAYKAYSAAGYTCMILWMIFALTALFLGTGLLPVLAVCILWAVLQSAYSYWAIKLSGCSSAAL